MTSNIDITQPPQGNAATASVRANFAAAKSEIEALQEAVAAPKTTVGDIASPGASVTLTPGNDDLISFTATANSTIDIAPAADGKSIILRITQDSTGGHSVTPGTSIAQGASLPGWSASTAANKTDYLALRYDEARTKWHLLAFNNGF